MKLLSPCDTVLTCFEKSWNLLESNGTIIWHAVVSEVFIVTRHLPNMSHFSVLFNTLYSTQTLTCWTQFLHPQIASIFPADNASFSCCSSSPSGSSGRRVRRRSCQIQLDGSEAKSLSRPLQSIAIHCSPASLSGLPPMPATVDRKFLQWPMK